MTTVSKRQIDRLATAAVGRTQASWSSTLRASSVVLGIACFAGCCGCGALRSQTESSDAADASARPLAERLAEEAARIPGLLSPKELLIFGAYALVAGLVAKGIAGIVHGLWRLGFDAERRMGRWVVFTKLVFSLAVASIVLRHFVEAAPTLSGAALILFAALAISTLRGSLENLAVGVGLVFRPRFKPGDQIVLAEHSGTVRDIGLTGVHLRSAEGTTVFLPNRLLHEHALRVTRADNTASVTVTLPAPHDLSPELLERARRIAILSPYRAVGTAVRIASANTGALEIEIQIQSSLLVADAKTQLRSALRTAISDASQDRARVEGT